jgi:hypothetical protein
MIELGTAGDTDGRNQPDARGCGKPVYAAALMDQYSRTKKPDAGYNSRSHPAVLGTVYCAKIPRDNYKTRRPKTDQYICTQTRSFAVDLSLKTYQSAK